MGMFDYIRCEVPLPDGFVGELQTKDFDCAMGEHVITKDGRLVLAILDHTEEVPKAERPYPDAPDESILSIAGSVRFIWRHEDANHHGMVNFYGSEYLRSDGTPYREGGGVLHQGQDVVSRKTGEPLRYVFHEYNAKFTDGRLVEIVVVPE